MKKTTAYQFRGYTIHVPQDLFVYIGNDETEFLIYMDEKDYALAASIRWLPSRESLKFLVSWRVWFEHVLTDEKEIYVDYDPNFNY